MLPKQNDLLLKEKVQLYNNIAQVGDATGRLLVNLDIQPSPRISWEYEILGETERYSSIGFNLGKQISPFKGHLLSIEKPILTGFDDSSIGPSYTFHGYAYQVDFGDIDEQAHIFEFYLPNALFQERAQIGQNSIIYKVDDGRNGEGRNFMCAGRYFEAKIADNWNVRLEIGMHAINWLKERKRNVGSFITTRGTLSSQRNTDKHHSMSLRSAISIFNTLSVLLSYANGGRIGPLYTQSIVIDGDSPSIVSASALRYGVTPIEQLSESWVAADSNLSAYLSCFPVLHRMLHASPWEETFKIVLDWYFQATNNKAWPIVANAIGTALERLSYTILVLEESDSMIKQNVELLFDHHKQREARRVWNIGKNYGNTLSVTGKRLHLLLERIGLTKLRGHNDTDDVMTFLAVRNEATHPIPGDIDIEEKFRLLNQARQWIDETLLWRLGYNGNYLNRMGKFTTPTEQRYDLSTRNTDW